ncbi:MAG: BrnT family toxin [Alphaproteobacteria bacterium]|nr:BrnT family toxin [Alphaproteobacteria bacterium]
MDIEYDDGNRAQTLANRGLDFHDPPRLFSGTSVTLRDDRRDYGEPRWLAYGWIAGRAVAMVWTQRGEKRRIISMRHMHDEEVRDVGLARPG